MAPRADVSGDRLGRRQVADRRRPLPRADAARSSAFARSSRRTCPTTPPSTADGGEIGRAQALQARACGVEPSVHMNPVLLKPQSEIGSAGGRAGARSSARPRRASFRPGSRKLLPRVLDSFARLKARSRHRAGRGRGQRGGDQPARERHRQHGVRARGGRSRRADRRHRPRRRHRPDRRNPRRARRRTTPR